MSDEAKELYVYVIGNFLEPIPANIEPININVAKKVDEFLREMNYCTRRLRIFTNIFLKQVAW